MLARQLKDSVADAAALDAADNTGKAKLKVQIRGKLLRFRPVIERVGAVFTDVVDEVAGHLGDLNF